MARKSIDKIELFLLHNVDIDNRIIYMGSQADPEGGEAGVDWQLSDNVIKSLALLDNIPSEKPITLIINNFGGEDDHCRAIMGAIRNVKAEVRGLVYGRAESAAAWILQVCKYRVMDKYSNLMFHMGAGTKDEHSHYVDNLFIDILLERLREVDKETSRSKLIKKLRTDWFVYPEEALKLGLVDEVIG